MNHRNIGRVVGLVVFVAICTAPTPLRHVEGFGARPAYAAAVAALMATWWLFEAFPMGRVALLPLLLFPVLGVFGDGLFNNIRASAAPYADAYIFLFLGGMVLGAAMEETQLHKRIALHIMRRIGTSPPRLLLGMLLATGAVSMWISNTATAVMMVPIAVALLRQLESQHGGKRLEHLGAAVMLAVAYGANVGGIGTKIGTGTNSIFAGFASRVMQREIGFVEFMVAAVPFVVIFLPVCWAVLWRLGRRDVLPSQDSRDVIERALAKLGPMSRDERKVLITFAAAATLWVLADVIRPAIIPLLPIPDGVTIRGKHYEATVAMMAGAAVLVMRCVSLRTLRHVPWDTLLLLGGSFAMAAGLEGSGFSSWMAAQLQALAELPHLLQIAVATAASVTLSAVASNTATINVLLNVLPRSLPMLFAATLGASCDFALPAGTPPNAIVFGSGYVRLPVMMRTGVVLDGLAVLAITLYAFVLLPLLF